MSEMRVIPKDELVKSIKFIKEMRLGWCVVIIIFSFISYCVFGIAILPDHELTPLSYYFLLTVIPLMLWTIFLLSELVSIFERRENKNE